jgi:digeranylgeranylglycerophospholipid reductase
MYDVIVVGAGPAGLVASEKIAAAGRRVLVCEEHEHIGAPVHCTGVLAEEALELLALPQEALLNPLSTVRFVAPSGDSFDYTTTTPEAVVIDRRVFDAALSARAERAGAEVRRGCRVTNVDIAARQVSVTTQDGTTIEARALLLACGASYRLHRALGLGMPSRFLQSAQIELPAAHPGPVEMHFGGDIAPKGFAWAVPVIRTEGSFVRIGVMAERDAASYFEQMLARVRDRWHVAVPTGLEPRRRMLPLGAVRSTFGPRVLAIGDAAGLVKPTTGGGIYYSAVSGGLAADVLLPLLERDELGRESLRDYERAWRRRFQVEFNAQHVLRFIAERMSDADIERLFDLVRTDGIIPLVRRTVRFNQHRDFIVALLKHPPARRALLKPLASLVS